MKNEFSSTRGAESWSLMLQRAGGEPGKRDLASCWREGVGPASLEGTRPASINLYNVCLTHDRHILLPGASGNNVHVHPREDG